MADTPRRLLILIHSLRGGGAGRVCTFLANGLSRRGWQVTVAVSLPEQQRWRGKFGPDVAVRQLSTVHARRSLPALVRLTRELRPDAVLAFNYQLAVLLPFVRTISRVPFRAVGRTVVALSEAARYRSFWQREIVMRFVRRRYRHLDLVVAQAEAMRRDLLERFGLRDEQVAVINNPADAPEIHAPGTSRDEGEAHAPTLLYLGRLKAQKQPCLLLDLLEGLVRRGRTTIRLLAAGEGPLTEEFLEKARKRGLAERIDYRGFADEVDPLFAEADLTVLTSRYEGFPNVLAESIARGVPVLSFDCPTGPADIVEEGINGRLVALNDIDGLIDAADRLLSDPPSPQQVRGTAARFRPEAILDRWEEVLRGRSAGAAAQGVLGTTQQERRQAAEDRQREEGAY